MAAPTLSAEQQRRTLKASSQKKAIVRATLATPYKTSWPRLNKDVETEILGTLRSTLVPLKLGRLAEIKYPDEVQTRIDRQKYKQEVSREHWKSGSEKRKSLVLGINAVTRALEKDQLAAAIICHDVVPEFMVQFLIPLCATRYVAAVAIQGLGTALTDLLSLKSCRAMGIKRDVENTAHIFHPLYKLILNSAKPLSNPLVEVSSNIQSLLDTSVELQPKSKVKKASPEPDYSHLYIYKGKEDNKQSLKKAPDFIALPSAPELDSVKESSRAIDQKPTVQPKQKVFKEKIETLKYKKLNLKRVHLPIKDKKRKKQKHNF